MTLNLTKQTEGCRGEGVWEKGVGLWTLGRVCALVSAVKCVNLVIHRPVPLGIKIHYMFIKKFINLIKIQTKQTKKRNIF